MPSTDDPTGFRYSLYEIGNAAGLPLTAIKKAVAEGKLVPENLVSLSEFVLRAHNRKSRRLLGEELLSFLPEPWRPWLAARWPRFDLYRCSAEDCSRLLFTAGACAEHGGDRKPPIKISGDGHILLALGEGGDYLSLHTLVAQTPKGMHCHHRDGNPWNNRWENLENLTPKEHEDRHIGGHLSGNVIANQPPRKPLHAESGAWYRKDVQRLCDESYTRGRADGLKQAQRVLEREAANEGDHG